MIIFINDSLLQLVTQHPYLGVLLENTMSFRSHLENIITKVTRMFRRDLYRCNQEVKSMAYTHLVRPMDHLWGTLTLIKILIL